MQVTLGRDEHTELHPNLHKVAQALQGDRGLLFTNRKDKEVVE